MIAVSGEDLDLYINNFVSDKWNMRDFVSDLEDYATGDLKKVYAISGLRGTGKTVGLLQFLRGRDALYVTAQYGEEEDWNDYLNLLKYSDRQIIVIDEITWIAEVEMLIPYLYTLVENGKRVIITGTESISIDKFRFGPLIHRIEIRHVTYMSFTEYCRLTDAKQSKEDCLKYLEIGGLFPEYAITNYSDMETYINEAILDNLYAYCGERYSLSVIKTIVYTIFYKAVCDSTVENVPIYLEQKKSLLEFLELSDADISYKMRTEDVSYVADILEQAGVIVKIKNFRYNPEYRTYIVNPSISYQLVKCIYSLDTVNLSLLGYIFESTCMCYIKNEFEKSYDIGFVNGRKYGIDFELDIVMASKGYTHNRAVYVLECKLRDSFGLNQYASIVSDVIDNLFPDSEIMKRIVIYNGEDKTEIINNKPVIYTNITRVRDVILSSD